MKLTTDNNTENLGHKKFNFRIDEKHQMKAIWALINLYEHKVRTPVQEIISNARDAHREVGKPDHTFKVRVTDNEFIVRDFGSGINPDKAQNIFCSIGESTKTGDNTQTGGFGIGAKSPLAYVNQFKVTSYVDGTEYQYIVAKNGEMLEMNVVSETTTNKPNGTKVIVPIKIGRDTWSGRPVSDKKKFIEAVQRCCLFWENKPDFNHEFAAVDVLMLKGMSRVGLHDTEALNGSYAVVDGIPYRVSGGNVVYFFNTGEIRLHETRERLADNNQDSEHNDKVIEPLRDKVNNYKFYENYIDKQNLFESFKLFKKYNLGFLYRQDSYIFRHNGFQNEDKIPLEIYTSSKGYRYGSKRKYKKEKALTISYETEFFYNDENESQARISRRVKNYIQQFVEQGKDKYVMVTDDKFLIDLFNAKKLTSLELPKINRSGEKKTTEEITITELSRYGGQYRRNRKLENNTTKYLYLGTRDDVSRGMLYFLYEKGLNVCKLSKSSIEAVKNDENFTDYHEWLANYVPTKEEKEGTYHNAIKRYYHKVNFTECVDKRFQKVEDYKNKYKYNNITLPNELKEREEIKAELEKIIAYNAEIYALNDSIAKDYPYLCGNVKHNTEYVNALYSYRNKE